MRPHCFTLTEACSCRLELAFFTGRISKNRLVCKNVVPLAYYGSCRHLVMGSWLGGGESGFAQNGNESWEFPLGFTVTVIFEKMWKYSSNWKFWIRFTLLFSLKASTSWFLTKAVLLQRRQVQESWTLFLEGKSSFKSSMPSTIFKTGLFTFLRQQSAETFWRPFKILVSISQSK